MNIGRKITKTPGVFGGDSCVENTRIPVWVLIDMRSDFTDDEILRNYPYLTQQDLDNAWEYYRINKNLVDSERQRHIDAE